MRKFILVNQNFNVSKNIHYETLDNRKPCKRYIEDSKPKCLIYLYFTYKRCSGRTVLEQKPHSVYKYNPLDGVRYATPRFKYFFSYYAVYMLVSMYTQTYTHTNTPTHRHIYYNRLFRNRIENLDFYVTWTIVKDPAAATAASAAAGPRETTLLHTVLLSS